MRLVFSYKHASRTMSLSVGHLVEVQVMQSLLDARDFRSILDSLTAILLLRNALLSADLHPIPPLPDRARETHAPAGARSGQPAAGGSWPNSSASASQTWQPPSGVARLGLSGALGHFSFIPLECPVRCRVA